MAEVISQHSAQEFTLPYHPSWIDRLNKWINSLPVPLWLFYVLSLLALFILISAVFWIDGSLPLGSISPDSSFSVFIVYSLFLYNYLTVIGSRALKEFLPLLAVDDHRIAQIEYELANLPRWAGRFVILLGVGSILLELIGESDPYGSVIPQTVLPYIFDVVFSSFMSAIFFGLIIRSIRQLRMVRKLHAQATNIDLLNLDPAHAFSMLSSQTGIGIVMVLVFAFIIDPTSNDTNTSAILNVVIMIIALGVFIFPIIGIKDDIEKEKKRVLAGINEILKTTMSNLHDRISEGNYRDVPAMEKGIHALIQERQLIEKISTWPWELRTFRSFASTLLLPIILIIISRLVEKSL